ncbi:hypothetical protein HDV01_005004 [Terramyces sp. JEL0728]|nr:hypothetical protein HDV01_005004 [Terramyces sp. JEL0728]
MQFTKFALFVAAVFARGPGGLAADPSGTDIGIKTATSAGTRPTDVPASGKTEQTSTLPPAQTSSVDIPIITSAPSATTTQGGKVETSAPVTKFTTEFVTTDIIISSTLVHTVVPKVVPILSGAASYSVVGAAAAAFVALAL